MALITQVCAFVSLVIGGVLLSSVSLVLAIVYMRKASRASERQADERAAVTWELMCRSLKFSMLVNAIALLLNVTAMILFYPILMELIQTGDIASVFGGSGSTPTGRDPIWG